MSESEGDSKICETTRKGEWSDLPHDLLLRITNDLGLLEFLSVHRVCKDWCNATLEALGAYKFSVSGCDPWFLMYGGEGSQCSLLINDDKIYAVNLPELDGATCLASYEGWLLLFRDGSMFFFCPFSRAKIDLPNIPFTELSDHTAAFSSAPTSQDCIVVVISRISDHKLVLHMLCSGDNKWAKHKFSSHKLSFSTITAAVFIEEFNFLDSVDGLVTFDAANTKQWNKFRTDPLDRSITDGVNYKICRDIFRKKDMRRKLGLDENVSISTCGTVHPHTSGKFQIVIQSESIIQAATRSASCHLKGV